MKFEDFISLESVVTDSWAKPLPKRHLIAIGATAVIAGSLFFILPDAKESTQNQSTAPEYLSQNSQDLISSGEIQISQDGSIIDSPNLETNAAQKVEQTVSAVASNDNQTQNTLNTQAQQSLLAEIIDPKAKLTDTIAQITDKTQSDISDDVEPLDNYEDTVPESILADSDSQMNEELAALNSAATGDNSLSAKWYVEDIQRGDTISSIFSDFNLSWDVMQAITKHKEAGNSLTNLRPGNHLSFLIDEKNNLLAFVKQTSATEQIRFYRESSQDKEFLVAHESLNAHLLSDTEKSQEAQLLADKAKNESVDVPAYKKRGRLVLVTVGKGQAFSSAAHASGLTYSEIEQITKLFKGRIQFSRHIQPGDTMRVLFSADKGEGKINAVEFKLARHGTLATFRNVADNKYYDENGYNVSTAMFRRFPIDGKVRISSHFQPHRRHPVTGQIRPHKGTDFAVPVGTPVVAPADGVVDKATYSKSAGYYIVLRHAGGYSTVYMHLSKLNVKAGQRVKIGSTIARSGNTGISTGPHLHYELRINNRPVNAMRVNLPKNGDATIAAKQRKRFDSNVALYKKELHEESLIAQID